MKNYEINEDTIAVIPIDYNKTKVIEVDNTYFIEKKAYEIMDESCQYYGSTYKGRLKASKNILDCSYKLPIIVEESSNVIFFPTKSSLEQDCCWLSINHIKKINKLSNKSEIVFNNSVSIILEISNLSLKNQISRATRLGYILNQRKIEK